MPKSKQKLSYMKTAKAEVKIRLKGKRIEFTVVLPSKME